MTPRRDNLLPTVCSQFPFSVDPRSIDQVGNKSSANGPAAQVVSERELREPLGGENEAIELGTLEVHCNTLPFLRDAVLTLSQREKERKEFGCKKQKEAGEHKEELEVHSDSLFFRLNIVLTPS